MNDELKNKELISRYIDNEVTSEERAYVEQLFKEDRSLYAYFKEMTRLDNLLDERPSVQISNDWEFKILSTIEGQNKEDPMKSSNFFKVGFGQGAFVAMLLVIVLFCTQVYVKRGVQGRLKSSADDIGDQYSVGNTSIMRQVTVSSSTFGMEIRDAQQPFNTDEYSRIYENAFVSVVDNPLSTFSIDVDTASYSNIRSFLDRGQLPPVDSVRIEEMVNYFSYNYKKPAGKDPFSITIDGAVAPWNKKHQLVRIGLQGKTLPQGEVPPSNLVFLIDVSGSMEPANKLPLLKQSLKMMVQQLSSKQRIAMVVYAGAAGKVLDSTPGSEKERIFDAIDRLSAGGSTAGGAGIKLAYEIAKQNYIEGGNNRVILATDGDFNVGVSSTAEMTRLIEDERKNKIFITVLGVGMGNYKDNRLEQIADKGNGTYHYIDTLQEAKKVLVEELGSTLFTIAKDVKLQVEFNPAKVKAYRLIGYENRMLKKEDFNDDTKDAGELGAGHTVTALYEIVSADSGEAFAKVDKLSYQENKTLPSNDLLTVKLRYKEPDQDASQLIEQSISLADMTGEPVDDFQFASAVVEFGLLLKNSEYKDNANYDHVIQSATSAKGSDKSGYRAEFIELVKKAKSLDNRPSLDNKTDAVGKKPGVMKFKNNEE